MKVEVHQLTFFKARIKLAFKTVELIFLRLRLGLQALSKCNEFNKLKPVYFCLLSRLIKKNLVSHLGEGRCLCMELMNMDHKLIVDYWVSRLIRFPKIFHRLILKEVKVVATTKEAQTTPITTTNCAHHKCIKQQNICLTTTTQSISMNP